MLTPSMHSALYREGMTEPNAFSGARLDRVGVRRRDDAWVSAQMADARSRAVVATTGGVYLLPGDPPRPALVELARLSDRAQPVLLGIDGDHAVFAVDGEELSGEAARAVVAGAVLVGLREAAAELRQVDGGLVAYASALLNWHRRHRHCSVCGARTDVAEAGLLRKCPSCGGQHHPRTDPVVIMLVSDGDRLLLGRQPSWPAGRYSALAGFVEPGESLEEAVVREVLEEAGVHVAEPRYVSSQPWPFPSSLMLGFTARFVGGQAQPRDDELQDVRWFSRAELSDAAGQRGPVRLPPRLAIARRLIDGWLAGA